MEVKVGSLHYDQRIRYMSFVENQKYIELGWDASFGDRKNEIVFIGQDMDEEKIRTDLESCLANEAEIQSGRWKHGYQDEWPVERAHALN